MGTHVHTFVSPYMAIKLALHTEHPCRPIMEMLILAAKQFWKETEQREKKILKILDSQRRT